MAFFTIPIPEEVIPFELQIELDTALFTLSFRYFPRDGAWRMTIAKAGTVILSSVKLVNTQDLLAQYTYNEALPLGKFIVSDQDLLEADPDSSNFGDRVLLMYQDTES